MSRPAATHCTLREGGDWIPWEPNEPLLGYQRIFAIKFSDGWIWDVLIGWRKPEQDILA